MKLNSSSTAFVFPGQGSQVVGMGKDLASAYDVARNIFEEADSILHFPFSKLMWDGPESELNDTVNTQPALFVHSMASFQSLLASLSGPQACRVGWTFSRRTVGSGRGWSSIF